MPVPCFADKVDAVTYAITVIEVPRRPTLVARCTAPADDLGRQFLVQLRRICDVVLEQRCALTDAPFVRYLGGSEDALDVEIGLILKQESVGSADVVSADLPAGPVAMTTHVGHYEELGKAHEALRAWATANGRSIAGPLFELYVTDPADGDDPGGWRTEVFLPLVA